MHNDVNWSQRLARFIDNTMHVFAIGNIPFQTNRLRARGAQFFNRLIGSLAIGNEIDGDVGALGGALGGADGELLDQLVGGLDIAEGN